MHHNLVVVVLEPRQEPKPALNPSMEDKLAQTSPVLKRASHVMLQPAGLTGDSGVYVEHFSNPNTLSNYGKNFRPALCLVVELVPRQEP